MYIKILETRGKIKNIEDTIKGDKNNMKKSETQFKKLKLDKRIVFGIIILVGLIIMPIDAYAAPTIIDFEDLSTGRRMEKFLNRTKCIKYNSLFFLKIKQETTCSEFK